MPNFDLLGEALKQGFVQNTDLTKKLTIDGISNTYPVYKIKLNLLYYNDYNARISTWISQYKAENKLDYMDMNNVQEYNSIIQKFIEESNPDAIKDTREDIRKKEQKEAGVVLKDGRIIDGNRRFSCLRVLNQEDNKFGYFEAVILDFCYENHKKQIKTLELETQFADEKVAYSPIERFTDLYQCVVINQILSIKEYAKYANMKESEAKKNLEIAKLLVEYLDFIKSPKRFYIVREQKLDGPLEELYAALKRISNQDERERVKQAAFSFFFVTPDRDMTRFTRKLKEILSSSHKKDFLDKQDILTDKVVELIPSNGIRMTAEISKVIDAEPSLQKELKQSVIRYSEKVQMEKDRGKQKDALEKCLDILSTIDWELLPMLSEIEQKDFWSEFSKLDTWVSEHRN